MPSRALPAASGCGSDSSFICLDSPIPTPACPLATQPKRLWRPLPRRVTGWSPRCDGWWWQCGWPAEGPALVLGARGGGGSSASFCPPWLWPWGCAWCPALAPSPGSVWQGPWAQGAEPWLPVGRLLTWGGLSGPPLGGWVAECGPSFGQQPGRVDCSLAISVVSPFLESPISTHYGLSLLHEVSQSWGLS